MYYVAPGALVLQHAIAPYATGVCDVDTTAVALVTTSAHAQPAFALKPVLYQYNTGTALS